MAALAPAMLGLPSAALAADAPEGLEEMVVTVASMDETWSVESAHYVTTTAEAAAALIGRRDDEFLEGAPERVQLVVLEGDFRLTRPKAPPGVEGPQEDTEEHGPYLAFLFSRQDGVPSTSELVVLQEAPPLDALGEPRAVEPFAIVHPSLYQAWVYLRDFLWFGASAVLLVVAAVLVGVKRRLRWPHLFGAVVAIAVAGWQTYLVLGSIAFVSWDWDPVFHGAKLAVLAVVVAVDLAAALALLKARSELARRDGGEALVTSWTMVGLPLLALATVLYLASFPWLATTGL